MEKTLDSYHDAVAKGQYAIYRLDNGVRVDYEIGDKSKGAESLPKQMDQARYEELFVNTDKLSETDKTFMQKRYLAGRGNRAVRDACDRLGHHHQPDGWDIRQTRLHL